MHAHECVVCTCSRVDLCSSAGWIGLSWISMSTDPSKGFRSKRFQFSIFGSLTVNSFCPSVYWSVQPIFLLSGTFWLLRALGLGYFGYSFAVYFFLSPPAGGPCFLMVRHTLLLWKEVASSLFLVTQFSAINCDPHHSRYRVGEQSHPGSKICLGREEKEKEPSRLFQGEETLMETLHMKSRGCLISDFAS